MNKRGMRDFAEKSIEITALLLAAYALRDYGMLRNQTIQNAFSVLCGCAGLLLFLVVIMLCVKAIVYKNHGTVFRTMFRITARLLCLLLFLLELAGKMSFQQTLIGIAGCLLSFLAGCCLPVSRLASPEKTKQKKKLYKSREEQLDELVRRIREDDVQEQTAICLSAEWGGGKTFFIDQMSERLADRPVLKINMLDMENIDQLFHYVYDRLSVLLQNQGYYVGIGSEFQRYVVSLGEVMVGKSRLPELLSQQLSDRQTDYRKMKAHLENVFTQAFSREKLLIVVDDLERCEADKAREYLRFVRELSTLPKTLVLFLADYGKLLNGNIISQDAANKFITEVLPLNEAGCDEIIGEFGETERVAIRDAADNVRKCFEKNVNMLNVRASALEHRSNASVQEGKNEIERERRQIWQARQYFERSMSNARRMQLLCQQMSRRLRLIELCLKDKQFYVERVQAKQQAFLISWMQTNLTDEFMRMSQTGTERYATEVLAGAEDIPLLTLRIMAGDLWIDGGHEVNSYRQQQCYECADHLLCCETALAGDAVWYVRAEEHAVDQARRGIPLEGEYDGYWRIIYLQSLYNGLDTKERRPLVQKTLRMMKEQCPRELCIRDTLLLMREQTDINLYPPGTLYHDIWQEVLASVRPCEMHGAGSWKEVAITLSAYWRSVKTVFVRLKEMLEAVEYSDGRVSGGDECSRIDSSGKAGADCDGDGSFCGDVSDEQDSRLDRLLRTNEFAAEDLGWLEACYAQSVERLEHTQFAAYPETAEVFAAGRIAIDELRAIQNVHHLLDAAIADENVQCESLIGQLEHQNEQLQNWQGYTGRAVREVEQIEKILDGLESMDSPPKEAIPLIHKNLDLIVSHGGDVHGVRIRAVKLEGGSQHHEKKS